MPGAYRISASPREKNPDLMPSVVENVEVADEETSDAGLTSEMAPSAPPAAPAEGSGANV